MEMNIGKKNPISSLPKPTSPIRVLGIDLGTTNSTIAEICWDPACMDGPRIRCLEIDQDTYEGRYTHLLVPSMVAIQGDRTVIGQGAKQLRARASELGLSPYKNLFYDCKNDIGIARTYHRAPDGYRSAAEIGGKVLEFLSREANSDNGGDAGRIVVTVPASFQAAQRKDTVEAARFAGMEIAGGDLLDEPVAAFLDYLSRLGEKELDNIAVRNLVVFDFGGGTCDVAIFRLGAGQHDGGLTVSPLAVSRYHRLGGGDIDAAILHEVLLPQLLEQNGLGQFEYGYEEKKTILEPAFLEIAESLKINLCSEISRLESFGKYAEADKGQIVVRYPGVHHCQVKGKQLTLKSPQLSAEQFEKLLVPFLDKDLLYARETEYRMTCSVFAPLADALERSGLSAADIDACLLVGGSSLIPQVVHGVDEFFPKAKILTFPDRHAVQVAVARGAAWHALSLALTGSGLVRPVCQDSIYLRTATDPLELVAAGTTLPFPSDGGYACNTDLSVPESSGGEPVDLRVEIISNDMCHRIFCETWSIPWSVRKGEKFRLEYRMDENQVLDLRLGLAELELTEDDYIGSIQNPLTNVVNPQSKRVRILELEEDLRTGTIQTGIPDRFVELADLNRDLGQKEKALEFYRKASIGKGVPDVNILNRMALCAGDMGDFVRQDKFFGEATKASSWSGTWFNWTMALKRRGQLREAVDTIDKALCLDREGPALVLRAMLADSLGQQDDAGLYLDEAFRVFDPVAVLNDWELGWFITGSRMAGEKARLEAGEAEFKRRRAEREVSEDAEGLLPEYL